MHLCNQNSYHSRKFSHGLSLSIPVATTTDTDTTQIFFHHKLDFPALKFHIMEGGGGGEGGEMTQTMYAHVNK
jgi:hypothetical protein